jgi:hypothetical protein
VEEEIKERCGCKDARVRESETDGRMNGHQMDRESDTQRAGERRRGGREQLWRKREGKKGRNIESMKEKWETIVGRTDVVVHILQCGS